ncbi:PAS domain-containing sensor histidine kinase [bacterium (Candidatus Blackallbacteria) CG17_big_fil_post_rev_8_21_14_2_50_48_46]|uniref:histidine kinase n=1 Tax=bacterium (Candidatus Blackallbacteria) CG17_big_fil_post_rev_8_21_14_2_50_48_46 TaxID=2014261 RepID=A0A2M7G735_9BACT|nr:MAG: PAS domain-containing sensor histidine kinase [bacterium (Candidatus Blackallbacteria) CG18_big_fil_WC_8_21_14_2_50_49_26]PIW17853.1 MAG: PAS domain-containing sensor histidine kinase [bacterium (Candidatus Blackallbacteria) CG17_big_fil_post_rev_8_21_14_2_50_48_46]PIW48529.1 MAG: PAS domain-containing sensor histidine kinase [bacterium (Candidatus Blackallbacteria) CG13_big_fil_rev_8_21_14_2_50_49_14]
MALVQSGVLLLDLAGQIQSADPEAQAILESGSELIGKSLAELWPDSPLPSLWAEASTGQEASQEFVTNWTARPKNIFVSLRAFSAQERGFLVLIQDLSAVRRLESIEREFITNVSHELRTPLTSIKMAAESLQMGAIVNPKLKDKFLSNIQREADRLTRLVNELIILANIEETGTSLHISAFDLFEVLDDVSSTMSHHSKVNDIDMVNDYPSSLPIISADRDRLSQVLINLVDNAIKCNRPNGTVTLHAHVEGEEAVIEVTDTGIGIPKIDLPRIFDRFFRVDKARSRVTGGTGLGLSIVKDIIEAHGGTISVNSVVNIGTTFTIRLPLKARVHKDVD